MGKEPQDSHRPTPDGEGWARRVGHITVAVYPKDLELVEWLTAYFGCSRSEAVRTAVRMAASQLAQVPQK